MEKFLDGLDHPIIFVFLLALALGGAMSLLSWGFKAADMPGAANVIKN